MTKSLRLLGAGEQVLEEAGLLADDARDAALHVLRRGEKAHRGPPPLGELRPPAGQELVVRVRLLEGVADDDAIDNVGHRRAPYARSRTTVDSLPYTSTTFTAMRL